MRNRRRGWSGLSPRDGRDPAGALRTRLRALYRVATALLNRQSKLNQAPESAAVLAERVAVGRKLEHVDAWIMREEASLTRLGGSR
jgi:hypothetical protein